MCIKSFFRKINPSGCALSIRGGGKMPFKRLF